MQQNNTTVTQWTPAETADTEHVVVTNENNKFPVRDLTVKACPQLHACLSKQSSIGPKQLSSKRLNVPSFVCVMRK